MDVVLRAYDAAAVWRAEQMPVERLLTALQRGALRSGEKRRVGLDAEEDVYARETIAERLEGLIQENRGEKSLAALSGVGEEDAFSIPFRGAVIDAEEAVALREDLVRYLTYGLWRAPEATLARVLTVVSGQPTPAGVLGGPGAFAQLRSVLDIAQDDPAFAAQFGEAARALLVKEGKGADPQAVGRELAACQQVLGPIARLLKGAAAVGLRVIAYQDEPGGEGLTRFLAQDQEGSENPPPAETGGNGHIR